LTKVRTKILNLLLEFRSLPEFAGMCISRIRSNSSYELEDDEAYLSDLLETRAWRLKTLSISPHEYGLLAKRIHSKIYATRHITLDERVVIQCLVDIDLLSQTLDQLTDFEAARIERSIYSRLAVKYGLIKEKL
jgi:hypothetical protein